MSDRDVDAQFADIIAHWDDVAAVPEHERAEPSAYAAGGTDAPTAPEVPGGDAAAGAADSAAATPAPPVGPVPSPVIGNIPVWRGAASPPGARDDDIAAPDQHEDDEEHFEPGPTAPLPPQEDLHFWGIVVGLVAGPLLLLWLVIFRPDVSGWWTLGALALTVGGFVLLVLRQPLTRDEDDPDNGARV